MRLRERIFNTYGYFLSIDKSATWAKICVTVTFNILWYFQDYLAPWRASDCTDGKRLRGKEDSARGYVENHTCPRKGIFGHLMMAGKTTLQRVPVVGQHRSSLVFGKVAL
jgi:hypothetical protein